MQNAAADSEANHRTLFDVAAVEAGAYTTTGQGRECHRWADSSGRVEVQSLCLLLCQREQYAGA